MKQIHFLDKTIFVALIALICSVSTAHAGFDQFMNEASNSASSFLHSAGQVAIGGGVIVVAVAGLIVGIALVFTLLMMLRR